MRTQRGLVASGLFSVLLLFAASAVDPAAAGGPARAEAATPAHAHSHEQAHGHDDAREHLAEDLVGTPMRVVEKQAAEAAARIERATGVRPGMARTRAAVAADAGLAGSWSPVVGTPVVPVFTAVLPNGRVLVWDSVGDNPAESYPDHSFTRAMVWNPVDNTYRRVDLQGTNIFCAGFAHLANGNILIAGGNANANLDGTVRTYIFNWQTETWTRGNDMAAARWYPAVAAMANGEEVIIGGGPATAEVYQTNGAIRALSGFTRYSARLYPFMGSRPDTQLGLIGPNVTAFTVNTPGNGVVTATGTRDGVNRDYGSFAAFDVGKSIVVGGGNITEGGTAHVPTRTAVVVNSSTGLAPAVTSTGSMAAGRRQHNATVLADGSVLVTGGMTRATSGLVDLNNAATAAERWDPATGQWTVLASASRVRQYHSTAVLLPDGRVMTGGGGICGTCQAVGYLEKNIEYFTPPYLYTKDGTGQLAPRPVISTAPASVGVNTGFTISTAQAASIRKVGLVGLSDATHGVDQGQRYVPLTFSTSGTTLTVIGPPNGGVAPPGHYMLFIVDAAGVPSVATMVQVAKGPNPVMSAVRNSTGRCIDVPSSATAIRTYLQAYNCNNTKAQALTRLPNDRSVRVLGNCLDVPSRNFVPGQPIWTYTCNNTVAQTWQFGSDGTVRPTGNTAVCLAAASSANNAAILLGTCDGTALQRWTW
ncbi:MAG TPA: galactose oxidase-like domain-containing protein [Micromonosporaceae bacterium]|nr:galactose oxidase-like domain-containing protein [Micromonosporaceae bacterium]